MSESNFKETAPSEAVQKYLEENLWNNFYADLFRRFKRRGTLTPRMLECVEKDMKQREPSPAPPANLPPREFSLKVGAKIEIKAWLAKRMKQERKLPIFFRNLEIMEVQDETPRAYLASVRFVSTVATSCHCCGKDLDTEISRATGIGPVCVKKYFGVRPSLERANEILAIVDKMCVEVGTIGPFWIPKSQIVQTWAQAHAPDSDVLAVRKLDEMTGNELSIHALAQKKNELAKVR